LDATGVVVLQQEGSIQKIDLQNLPRGPYYLNVLSDEKEKGFKLLIP
jgi:hypothetical protein